MQFDVERARRTVADVNPALSGVGGVEERPIQREDVDHRVRRQERRRLKFPFVFPCPLSDVFDARGQREQRRVACGADDRADNDAARRGCHHCPRDHDLGGHTRHGLE